MPRGEDGTGASLGRRHRAEVLRFKGHSGPVLQRGFDHDGKRIVSAVGRRANPARRRSGRRLQGRKARPHGEHQPPSAVPCSAPMGARRQAGWDGTVRLWRPHGQELTTLRGSGPSWRASPSARTAAFGQPAWTGRSVVDAKGTELRTFRATLRPSTVWPLALMGGGSPARRRTDMVKLWELGNKARVWRAGT